MSLGSPFRRGPLLVLTTTESQALVAKPAPAALPPTLMAMSDDDRLYFRQLLSGRDFATEDQFAKQMVNFCYVVGDRESGEAVIIDPAYEPGEIVDLVEADGLTVTGVLATHYHADHMGGNVFGNHLKGVRELLDRVDVPVHIQAPEAEYVQKTTDLTNDELVLHGDRDIVSVGDIDITLIHTPGHTPGSQCFLVDGNLLAGDTLFIEGCGRTDLPGGDTATLMESLHKRLAEVPDEAELYPGHLYAPQAHAKMGLVRQYNYVFHGA